MHHSNIDFIINNESYSVHALEGEEKLSTPFDFNIKLLESFDLETLQQMLGDRGKLYFTQNGSSVREFIGVITEVSLLGHYNDDQVYFQFRLQSQLALLAHSGGFNHYPEQDLRACVIESIKKHGLSEKQITWISNKKLKKNNYLQFDFESDLDFLTRILTQEGIYFYSGSKDEQEIIYFCHDHYHEKTTDLTVSKASSLNNDPELSEIRAYHQLVCNKVILQNHEHLIPSKMEQQEETLSKKAKYKKEYFNYDKLKTYVNEVQNKQFYLKARGTLMELKLGARVALDTRAFNSQYDGIYHIVSLKHRAKQPSGKQGQGKATFYEIVVTLLPDHCKFQKSKTFKKKTYLLEAKIVCQSPDVADLNENGHYKIRYLFDDEKKIVSNVPRLTPYASQAINENQGSGFHTPLLDDTEVIVGFLYDDPNQAVILGSLPNQVAKSPVIDENCFDNYIITPKQHQLLMHESEEGAFVNLATRDNMQQFILDSKSSNKNISLINQEGDICINSGVQIGLSSGHDLIEHSKGISLYEAQDSYHLKSGDNHYFETKELMNIIAKKDIGLSACQDLKINSGDLNIKANNAIEILSEGEVIQMNTEEGEIMLNTQNEMLLQGISVEKLFFGNQAVNVSIDAAGSIVISGETANLLASEQLIIKGTVKGE